MKFKIKRVDGESDEIKSQSFASYDEAYDLLASMYADTCFSNKTMKIDNIMKLLKLKNNLIKA